MTYSKVSIQKCFFLSMIVFIFICSISAAAKPKTAKTASIYVDESIRGLFYYISANQLSIDITFSEVPDSMPRKKDFFVNGKALEDYYAGKLGTQGILIGTIKSNPLHYRLNIYGKTGPENHPHIELPNPLSYKHYKATLIRGSTVPFIDLIKKYMSSVRTSFQSVWEKGDVVISWTTEAELNNAGFNILRSETPKGPFEPINAKLIPSAGSADTQHTYKWIDTTAKRGTDYYYQIEDLSFSGKRNQLATIKLEALISPKNKLTTQWGAVKRRY